jgi:hypothetical protein
MTTLSFLEGARRATITQAIYGCDRSLSSKKINMEALPREKRQS